MIFGPIGLIRAQEAFLLQDSQEQHIFVFQYIAYLEDTTHQLGLAQVMAPAHASQFRLSQDFAPRNYNPDATYWLRVKVAHPEQTNHDWLLEFFDQTIDSITAYIPNAEGAYRRLELGDTQPFRQRPIAHKNFVIPLEMLSQGTYTYYFRVRAAHPVDFIVVLRSHAFFTYYSLNEYFYFGLFYGLLVLIALYNLLLFVALRERPYFHLVGYALCVALYFSSSDGFAYQYLWPNWPVWNQVAYGLFMWLTVAFAILFTQSFLHLRTKAPLTNRLLWGLLILRTAYFILCLAYRPVWFDYLVVDLASLLALLVVAVVSFRAGYQPARLFMLALIFVALGVVIKILLSLGLGLLESNALNYYSFHLAFLLQLITFSFALGDKVRILRKNRDLALKRMVKQLEINAALQTKVNRELEEKVAQRTAALEGANQKLKAQAEEITQINQLLDKHNWHLKKASTAKLRNRLLSKGVSYDEFHRLFPDEVSCLQYLAQVKWEQGYACRKCGYTGGADNQHFGKRCQRCGYVESATSHTVFHNLRFPLEKAFYLAHVEISGLKFTGKELAERLDLRPATCTSFRKRVREAMAQASTDSQADVGLVVLLHVM